MNRIRLALVAVIGLLAAQTVWAAQPHPFAGFPEDPAERARAFATCAGRYAGIIEHGSAIGADASSARSRRDTFTALVDASGPGVDAAGPGDLLRYRLGAKRAIARLLILSQTHADRHRARTAATLARRLIAMCDTLI